MSHNTRLDRYDSIATALSLLSDRQLQKLLDEASTIHSGIGGTAVLLNIQETPVFVKRVPLSDLERLPENIMSTANLFDLPPQYHYGLISLGFGVWRELAAQTMTTNWVLAGKCESFPLMYHWRVLDDQPRQTVTSETRAEMSRMLDYWKGSQPVRKRLDAIEQSTSDVVIFLECVPQNLYEWLNAQVALGDQAIASACAMVERNLNTEVSFMNSNGLLHFDAHFRNILTDGERLYFVDFGLAMSPRFELSPDELEFLRQNQTHDERHTITQLVNWIVTTLCNAADRNEFIRQCTEGGVVDLEPSVSAILKRNAPVAVVVNKFYRELYDGKDTAWPG